MAAYQAGDHLVATSCGSVIGFVGTQRREVKGEEDPRGEVMLLVVNSAFRRRGVGRHLLGRAEAHLRENGVKTAQLCSGGSSYFWPGAPVSLPDAWEFFHACGWEEDERSYDLVCNLKQYVSPDSVFDCIQESGVTVATSSHDTIESLRRLLDEHFPAWADSYAALIEEDDLASILVAVSETGEVVGFSSAEPPSEIRPSCHWASLKRTTGVIGALGVHPEWRERGIGLAIAARVMEVLRDQGAENCFIGWTWLVDWYGKLGSVVWETYVMSRKNL